MKNAMRLFCLILAAFMVACGGNPPTDPNPTDPNPNPCEPNCTPPVTTITRGLTFPTSGNFIDLNGTHMLDAQSRPVLTAGDTMVMIQIPTAGRTTLDIIERRSDGTAGRLLANSSGRNFMPETMNESISRWYWVYGVYADGSGDWFDFDRPAAASDPWADRNDIEPDPRCPAGNVGWGPETRRRIGSLGQVGVPQLCNHDNRTVSLCACRDPNGGSEPVMCPGCTDHVMAWGTLSFPENRGEVLDLTIISFLEDPPYRSQRKFGRQL